MIRMSSPRFESLSSFVCLCATYISRFLRKLLVLLSYIVLPTESRPICCLTDRTKEVSNSFHLASVCVLVFLSMDEVARIAHVIGQIASLKPFGGMFKLVFEVCFRLI